MKRSIAAVSRLMRWAYSVPLVVKILGAGVFVTIIFGAVTYYCIQTTLLRAHFQIHAEGVRSIATSLSDRVVKALDAGDQQGVEDALQKTLANFPDIRFIVVENAQGQLIAHKFTFPAKIPYELLEQNSQMCASCHGAPKSEPLSSKQLALPPDANTPGATFRAWSRSGGVILETKVPLPGNHGELRIGVSDTIVGREVSSVIRALLLSLGICLVIGQGLALALAYVVVHPIQNLVKATNRLRAGDFHARATVYANDEVGKLAAAFNSMAEALDNYRREVNEKEAARVSLLERLVSAQEDERKSVARELHDQLGQSLSSVLLNLQGMCKDCGLRKERCGMLESDIRGLIDEVRRLAWDIRPAVLDDYGLDSALERYVQETSAHAGIAIDYECVPENSEERLPSPIEVTLYRVAQEALLNVVRHAGATQVSVVLHRDARDVTLFVEDNGTGFDAQGVMQSKEASLGLLGIKERVALIGGEFTVESEPGKGTAMRIRVRLKEKI